MKKTVAINALCRQLGLTSRTLRHWEAEGLFHSGRDAESGWRVYDDDAVFCIRLTALLRKYDIAIRDIRRIVENRTYRQLYEVIGQKMNVLAAQRVLDAQKEAQLSALFGYVAMCARTCITTASLLEMEPCFVKDESMPSKKKVEETYMSHETGIRIVVMPPMRTVRNVCVGVSPEDDAMQPVLDWIEKERLLGTARFFGFNTEPWPDGAEAYGYGMCASIPEGVSIPPQLQEMRVAGGLYAVLESNDDIGSSWQRLLKGLEANDAFEPERGRMCFEEHVAIIGVDGERIFSIWLMEPVRQTA